MKEKITFNELPEAVSNLTKEVTALKHLIIQNQTATKQEVDDMPIDIQEASTLLKLSVPTIYSKVSRNEIPYMKQGKRLYFSKTELIDWIKKGKSFTEAEIQRDADAFLSKLKKD